MGKKSKDKGTRGETARRKRLEKMNFFPRMAEQAVDDAGIDIEFPLGSVIVCEQVKHWRPHAPSSYLGKIELLRPSDIRVLWSHSSHPPKGSHKFVAVMSKGDYLRLSRQSKISKTMKRVQGKDPIALSRVREITLSHGMVFMSGSEYDKLLVSYRDM